jgi:histidinol-phosphate aminotransferase
MNRPRHDVVKSAVVRLQAYDPHTRPGRVKLDANEHAFALPATVRGAVLRALDEVPIHRYPDPEARDLRGMLATMLGVTPDMLLLGNGSDELVQLALIACGEPGGAVLTPTPTFSMYRLGALMLDQRPIEVPLTSNWALDLPAMLAATEREQPRVTVLANPNNPTANCFEDEALRRLIEASPGAVIIDEAYHEYSGRTVVPLLDLYPHLLVFRTLSKVGMAGLRVGVLVGNPELVRELNKVRLPYNLNAYSQVAAEVVLRHWEVIAPEFQTIIREREWLRERLGRIPGVTAYPSQANFLLVRLASSGEQVWDALGEQGILVRHFPGSPALQNCLRITVGTAEENDCLAGSLRAIMAELPSLSQR